MRELRILNGLHRGATLPLDNRPYLIGSSDDADVVLVDPGIETEHASLSLTEAGWGLTALDGNVLGADDNIHRPSIDVLPGGFARIGHIWVTVVAQDAPWENPPPEPVDLPPEPEPEEYPAAEAGTDDAAAGMATEAEDTAASQPVVQETLPADEEAAAASPESDGSPSPPAATEPAAGKWHCLRRLRQRRAVFVSLGTLAVLSACATYAMTSKTDSGADAGVPKALAAARHASASGRSNAKPGASPGVVSKEEVLSPEELRNAFRKRLSDVDLLKRFDLQLEDHSWTMQAALDDDEAARFGRVLAQFVTAHKITFPIQAKVGSAEAMLPFKIRQIISGSNASVVTDDGNRLYVGDEYKNMRLAAIQGNRLTFTGQRKIEVRW